MQELNKDIDIKIGNNIIARVEVLRNEGDKDADIHIHNVCNFDLKFDIKYTDNKNIPPINVKVKTMDSHLESNVEIDDIIELHSLDYNKIFIV